MGKYSIVLLMIIAITMVACEKRSTNDQPVIIEGAYKNPQQVKEFEYKGHKYISFKMWKSSYDNGCGYVHDPDCPCLTGSIQ